MKIRKVKYNNHQVLGNIELDFVNPTTGKAYDYIIFLGENGTGKTTILNTISDYLNCVSLKPFSFIEYEADGLNYRIEPLNDNDAPCFHKRVDLLNGNCEEIRRNKNNNREQMYSDTKDARSYACVLSKARADFATNKISTTKTSSVDTATHEDDNQSDYTGIKQMFVDLYEKDCASFVQHNQQTGENFSTYEPSTKLYRFKKAFNAFFSDIKFSKVEDKTDEKVILFEKDGKEIQIDDLSTGEKQIVYRGAYLLRNSGKMDEGTAFIDEPELSMHPLWERKILKYFKDLYFEQESNKSKAQLFFASHSDSIVADAMNNKENHLVIVLNNENGSIKAKPITSPTTLPTITAAEINYLAFGIYSVDYHIALFGYLQTLTGHNTVSSLDNYIANSPLYNAAYEKVTSHNTTTYHSICTLIRNNIDHPDNGNTYTYDELKMSTDFLIQLIDDFKTANGIH